MKAVFLIVVTCGLVFAGIGTAIRLGDRSVLVPPPEAVAEGFVRQLETGRYSRAIPYLAADLASRTTPDTLRILYESLQARAGRIHEIRGDRERVGEDRAVALALLRTETGPDTLRFPMRREHGVWSIESIEPLAASTSPAIRRPH